MVASHQLNTIVIVDAYSQAASLVKAFNAQGYRCVHVRTVRQLHAYYEQSICAQDYVETLWYDGDFAQLLQQLAPYSITHVCAGFDMGVALADQLNEAFNLPGNGTALSAARCDKYQQRLALVQAQVKVPSFKCATDWRELAVWLDRQSLGPWVLKPLNSASAEDVYRCHDVATAEAAFQRIQGKQNQCGISNQHVLAEGFLTGREYRVNTVSRAGRCVVTDVWDMTKVVDGAGRFLYDQVELLPATGAVQKQLIAYIEQVLQALAITEGPTTSDIVMTKNGPVLVELGARLMGGLFPIQYLQQCITATQLDVMIEAYAKPERFAQRSVHYALQQSAKLYLLRGHVSGQLHAFRYLEDIQNLPTVRWVKPYLEPGDWLAVTHDYASSPMHLLLMGNAEAIAQDMHRIQQFESLGLYVLQ